MITLASLTGTIDNRLPYGTSIYPWGGSIPPAGQRGLPPVQSTRRSPVRRAGDHPEEAWPWLTPIRILQAIPPTV